MKKIEKWAGYVAAVALMMQGCAMKEAPPVHTYTMDVGKLSMVASSRYKTKVIKVAYPETLKEEMTDKMCYSYSSSDRGVYLNSEWSNAVEKLVQGNLIDMLQQSHIFKAVLPYTSLADEDYRLESVIYDISHHIRGNHSDAIVSMQFTLVDSKTGVLLKTKHFSYKEPTPTVDASGYVQATNRAMHQLAQDLMRWLKER